MSGVTCPSAPRFDGDLEGCGSSRVTEPDDEGLVDCLDCGLFFRPDEYKSSAGDPLARLQSLMVEYCVQFRKLAAVLPFANPAEGSPERLRAALTELEAAVISVAPDNVNTSG